MKKLLLASLVFSMSLLLVYQGLHIGQLELLNTAMQRQLKNCQVLKRYHRRPPYTRPRVYPDRYKKPTYGLDIPRRML